MDLDFNQEGEQKLTCSKNLHLLGPLLKMGTKSGKPQGQKVGLEQLRCGLFLQILAVKWLDFNHSTTTSKNVKCVPTTTMNLLLGAQLAESAGHLGQDLVLTWSQRHLQKLRQLPHHAEAVQSLTMRRGPGQVGGQHQGVVEQVIVPNAQMPCNDLRSLHLDQNVFDQLMVGSHVHQGYSGVCLEVDVALLQGGTQRRHKHRHMHRPGAC